MTCTFNMWANVLWNFNNIVSVNWGLNESWDKFFPFPPDYLISNFFFLSPWLDLFLLSSHWIPNSHPNRKHIPMQNSPKRQPQLRIISCCFSKSGTNFMRIVSANMYINLALRVWCRALLGLKNQTETVGRNRGGESASFYCITPYLAKTNNMMSYIRKFCDRRIITKCCLVWCCTPIAAALM